MQREEKQLESLLEAVLRRLNDLKRSIGEMIHKLETEYETINWPTFLDHFAVISSDLTGLSKILAKEIGPPLRNRTVLPLNLSPERDELLFQLTEGRVPVFSHDIVPDYLRTKPEPAAEQRMLQHEQKANNLLAETAMKQIAQYNKIVSHTYDMVSKAREEWEIESSSRSDFKKHNMAFYSVRVDDDGKEINTTRRTGQTFRNINLNEIINENDIKSNNSSLRTFKKDIQQNKNHSIDNIYRTVRYVNSAAFIENNLKVVKKPQKSDCNQDNLCLENANNNDQQKFESHIENNLPLLELNSNQSLGSSIIDNSTYSFRRINELTNMIQKPDAYNEWIEAKRRLKFYEKKKQMEKLKTEEEQKEKKRTLAELNFNKWLENKKLQQKKEKIKKEENPNNKNNKGSTSERLDNDKNEKNKNTEKIDLWLEQKLEQERLRKKKLEEENKINSELKSKRQKEAEEKYLNWLKTAPYRPKPVPLNQGFYTLKGSISELFINPQPWVPIIDEKEQPI